MKDDDLNECRQCGKEAEKADKFCRYCGCPWPASLITWDWREQPNFDAINAELEKFGCTIVEVETGDDQHAVRVTPTNRPA